MLAITAFDRRRRRHAVLPGEAPAAPPLPETERLMFAAAERLAFEQACAAEGHFGLFARFFAREWPKYGRAVRPGLLALAWMAVFDDGVALDSRALEASIWKLVGAKAPEFLAWSTAASDLGHVIEARTEFEEHLRVGRSMRRWRTVSPFPSPEH